MIKIKIKIISEKQNLLPGGSGDHTDPDSLDQEELYLGSEEEMEHTNDPAKALEISTDHLTDKSDYYTQLKQAGLTDKKPLEPKKSKKLSKYWKIRAKRRALKAERKWPNKHDRSWALSEQEKSYKMNKRIYALIEKELEESEDISNEAKSMMLRMKNKLKKIKLEREAAKFLKPQQKMNKKNPPSTYNPPHEKGETVGGYAKKAAKKLGGIGYAPSAAPPGGIREEKKNETK